MPTQTTLSRVESFPFDSRSDGYDADGYPVYDRAVGASMLRATFEKFFSDGVFPSPGNALQISKGSGLTVTIQPGIFIINGAMGGYLTDAHSLTLDTAAPQGNVAYGIMLRYDETEQHRSCYLRVVRGDAAGTPTPPEPDQSTPGVMEYRLGYVVVPSGATDLTSATVTNEKGLTVCPYAAPFEEIDLSEILGDVKRQTNESLQNFLAFLQQNIDLVNSAIDDTTAGNLQAQINELENGVITSSNIDGATLEFSPTTTSGGLNVLRVKDGGIDSEQLADQAVSNAKIEGGSVDKGKLATSLLIELGIIDYDELSGGQAAEIIPTLDQSTQHSYVTSITESDLLTYTWTQEKTVLDGLKSSTDRGTFISKMNLEVATWQQIRDLKTQYSSLASNLVGKTKSDTFGSLGSVTFRIVGVDHETETGVDTKDNMTFCATKIVAQDWWRYRYSASSEGMHAWGANTTSNEICQIRQWCNGDFYNSMPSSLKSIVKQRHTGYSVKWGLDPGISSSGDGRYYNECDDYVWIPALKEISTAHSYGTDSPITTVYDYFSSHDNDASRVMQYNGSNAVWYLRTVIAPFGTSACTAVNESGAYWDSGRGFPYPRYSYETGIENNDDYNQPYGVVPMFCI